jgi:hypothetical protein
MKHLIKEALHKIAQKKGVTVPQDYSKEFGQTGSGKAIFGKPNISKATEVDINRTKERINDSIEVAKVYRNAYVNGNPDETGNIPFRVMYQGRVYDAKIPQAFLSNQTAGGKETDYMYYFNVAEIGDGAMQIKYDKRGYGEASVVRSKTHIPFNPDLGSAADAGYSKDYEGRHKYVTIKVGVRGKYQGEAKFYSVFPSPAMDAKIKADIAFRTEILDFMIGGGDYTTDNKGAEISNIKMDLDTKIQKVRKDAEMIIGKPLASNSVWLTFKDELKQMGDFDAQQMTQQLLQMLKGQGVKKKSEIGMSPEERTEWEKQQQDKLARIAAAKARMKKY